jgi:hypothetical protein
MTTSTIAPDMLHAPVTRDHLIALCERLPATTSYAQAVDLLLVNAAIAQGQAEIEAGLMTPHDEVVRRFRDKLARRDAGRQA